MRRAYRGYLHHRWVFTIKDDVLWMFPKLSFIEIMEGLEFVEPRVTQELSFFWKDYIPYKIFQDDWLGPNPWEVVNNYREQIKDGL